MKLARKFFAASLATLILNSACGHSSRQVSTAEPGQGTTPGSPTTGANQTCSIARLDASLQQCLESRSSEYRAGIAKRVRLWAESTGDASGRPGRFPAELLDLTAFRSHFSITETDGDCLHAKMCHEEES